MALEQQGATVRVIQADVANRAEMERAIEQALQAFGELHGVIHAAGVPGGGAIQRKTIQEVEQVFSPKVQGTLVLDSLVGHLPLDFFALCSSVASPLGGFGQVDYCAANAFMDAFAHKRRAGSSTLYTSIDWDTWKDVGMAVDAQRRAEEFQYGTRPVAHPLLQRARTTASTRAFSATFATDDLWVLKDHVVLGSPTLVGTAYLEMARAAFQQDAVHAASSSETSTSSRRSNPRVAR